MNDARNFYLVAATLPDSPPLIRFGWRDIHRVHANLADAFDEREKRHATGLTNAWVYELRPVDP